MVMLTSDSIGHDTVTGTEPWDLPKLLADFDDENRSHPMLACVESLRKDGPRSLTQEQRAFWLSYQNEAKSPLPSPGKSVALDLTQALVALKKATPDVPDLESAMEQVEHSLVSQWESVGLFAKRGPIRSVSLPDWCRMAVTVNTKARYWEVQACGHSIIHIPMLLSACAPGEWTGHRYRARRTGLPDVRTLHQVMATLVGNLRGAGAK